MLGSGGGRLKMSRSRRRSMFNVWGCFILSYLFEILLVFCVIEMIAALAIFICWRLDLRAAARERRELYDRIQAGTLIDYKRFEPKPVERNVPSALGGYKSVDELTTLEDDTPDNQFVEARTAFNSLLEGE